MLSATAIDTNWCYWLTQWANSSCTFCRRGKTQGWFILGVDSEVCLMGEDSPSSEQLGAIILNLRSAIALACCEWVLTSKGSASIWSDTKSATANILGDPYLSLLAAWCKFQRR